MRKNAEIQMLRFFMILGVMILHFNLEYIQDRGTFVQGGHLGVDFFFMITGFFMCTHAKEDDEETAWLAALKYTLNKAKKLWVPYILAAIIINIYNYFFKNWDVSYFLKHMWEIKWEYIFMHHLGAGVPYDLGSIWFMSVLVFCVFFIYFLLKTNRDFYLGIIPIVVIIINVIFYKEVGHLGTQEIFCGFINGGILKGFADMSLGVLACEILRETDIKNTIMKHKVLAYVIKFLCLGVLFVIITILGYSKEDFFVLPVLFCLLILINVIPYRMYNNKIVYQVACFLGKLSYPLYCYHLLCVKYISRTWPNRNYFKAVVLYVVMTILVSCILDVIVSKGSTLGKKVFKHTQ